MGKLTTFLTGAAKLAIGLFMACVLLVGVFWGYTKWTERAEDEARRPLAVRKDWPPNSFLSGVANLKTAWRDGNLYYQLDIPEYSPSKFVVRDGAKITLEFSDSDGFKLFEQEVPYSALTQRLDPGGVISGLSWAGDQYLNPDLYKRAAVVALLWRGIEKR